MQYKNANITNDKKYITYYDKKLSHIITYVNRS
jgi:hypothetical protein